MSLELEEPISGILMIIMLTDTLLLETQLMISVNGLTKLLNTWDFLIRLLIIMMLIALTIKDLWLKIVWTILGDEI